MAWYGFGNLSSNYNGQSFDPTFGHPSIADNLYFHSGDIANEIFNTSQAIWEREDTAVQRWVKDVKAAGLNPYGFSGQGSATANVNPSMDSLSSLLGILGGMLNTQNTSLKGAYGYFDRLMSLFGRTAGALTSMIG